MVAWLRRHPASVAFVLIVGVFFWGEVRDSQNRAGSRTQTCEAFHALYVAQRDKIAEDDTRFQSGAYDKLFPAFASPAVKKLTHENAVRNFNRFDNSNLPSYCPQRDDPEGRPKGFRR